jgi:hypothetical protein
VQQLRRVAIEMPFTGGVDQWRVYSLQSVWATDRLRQLVDELLAEAISDARAEGASWGEICQQLAGGISKQAAQQRMRRLEAR